MGVRVRAASLSHGMVVIPGQPEVKVEGEDLGVWGLGVGG